MPRMGFSSLSSTSSSSSFCSSPDGVDGQRAAEAHLLDGGGQGHRLRADAAADGRSQVGHPGDHVAAQRLRGRPAQGNQGDRAC